jgi:hypothetical protein
MKRALSNEQIAAWLRSTAGELFDTAVQFDSNYQIQGRSAEKEYRSLESAVKALGPCRPTPMPRLSGRPESFKLLELTSDLLVAIGLRVEDIDLLAGRIPQIALSPERELTRGAESIIEQMRKQGASDSLIKKTRHALARLALVRDFLKVPRDDWAAT